MLHPPQHAVHLFEEDVDRSLGGHTHPAYNSANENTPRPAILCTPVGPGSGDPLLSLHDIYAEQNARLQGWALRSQTCLPIKLEDKLEASFPATGLINGNPRKSHSLLPKHDSVNMQCYAVTCSAS